VFGLRKADEDVPRNAVFLSFSIEERRRVQPSRVEDAWPVSEVCSEEVHVVAGVMPIEIRTECEGQVGDGERRHQMQWRR